MLFTVQRTSLSDNRHTRWVHYLRLGGSTSSPRCFGPPTARDFQTGLRFHNGAFCHRHQIPKMDTDIDSDWEVCPSPLHHGEPWRRLVYALLHLYHLRGLWGLTGIFLQYFPTAGKLTSKRTVALAFVAGSRWSCRVASCDNRYPHNLRMITCDV